MNIDQNSVDLLEYDYDEHDEDEQHDGHGNDHYIAECHFPAFGPIEVAFGHIPGHDGIGPVSLLDCLVRLGGTIVSQHNLYTKQQSTKPRFVVLQHSTSNVPFCGCVWSSKA